MLSVLVQFPLMQIHFVVDDVWWGHRFGHFDDGTPYDFWQGVVGQINDFGLHLGWGEGL